MKRATAALVLSIMLIVGAPSIASASPFGGQVEFWWPCFVFGVVPYGNISLLSAPNPGLYIWTPFTKTYPNGPPTHPGQWLLGQTGIPYICVVQPIGTWIVVGTTISMMGSS